MNGRFWETMTTVRCTSPELQCGGRTGRLLDESTVRQGTGWRGSRTALGVLGQLRVRCLFNSFLCVHGSPRRPINEYIFPEDAINSPVKMSQIFDLVDTHCLVGHTHVPGVFTNEPEFYPPTDLGGVYKFNDDERVIVNPGSVGQPRDMDPRASYAILDEEEMNVEFHRLDYDVESVARKIYAIPELNNWLGDRLLEGR